SPSSVPSPATLYVDYIKLDVNYPDLTPPTGSILINGGDEYTDSTGVTLTLSASDTNGVSQMRFSNDGTSWSIWESYTTSKTWTLTASDGTKTVYVEYRDSPGNICDPVSDTIILDMAHEIFLPLVFKGYSSP
ncbi:MAG: Ig-like domain-containing protein, partial [Anaerolineae bacterium]